MASASSPTEYPRTNEGIRTCQIIQVKAEVLEEYKKIHAEVWPSVLTALRSAHIFDYSIHLVKLPLIRPTSASASTPTPTETLLLIAHMRYLGGTSEDLKRDMARIAMDPETQKWWKLTIPCSHHSSQEL